MIKYHAHFAYNEICLLEREASLIEKEDEPYFFNSKVEALAELASRNWKRYDDLKKDFDENAKEILERKDKIHRKIVEASKE